MSLSNEILTILENNGNMQYNSKAILDTIYGSKSRDMPPSEMRRITAKIRTELKRLSDRKKINRKQRGFYQAKPLPHVIQKLENPNVQLHGLKIECYIVENNTKGMLPIPPKNNIENWLDARGFEPISHNRWSLTRWWENKKITFIIHSKGLIEIFARASNNPFEFLDFSRWLDWLNGFFDPLIFDRKEMWVRQIGYARDFRLLRLEGVSSVSLQVMMNVWSQVYQKGDMVRFEHHMTFPKTTIDVDTVARSLMMLTTPMAETNGIRSDERRDVA